MEILSISRGQIKINLDNNALTINGEAMMPQQSPNLSEYIIYKDSFKWVNLNNKLPIDDDLKHEVLIFLEEELRKRNLKIIIE